jgi:hypothetical protein
MNDRDRTCLGLSLFAAAFSDYVELHTTEAWRVARCRHEGGRPC